MKSIDLMTRRKTVSCPTAKMSCSYYQRKISTWPLSRSDIHEERSERKPCEHRLVNNYYLEIKHPEWLLETLPAYTISCCFMKGLIKQLAKSEIFRYTDFRNTFFAKFLFSLIDINEICFKVEMFKLFNYKFNGLYAVVWFSSLFYIAIKHNN